MKIQIYKIFNMWSKGNDISRNRKSNLNKKFVFSTFILKILPMKY